MVSSIIEWSLGNRFVVMLLAVVLMGVGFVAVSSLPLDAVPDLTNVQVQVLTTSPSLGPVEVEQFITFPVENAMSGLPRVSEIRSISRFGLSAVTVAFEEGTDVYWARNLINERLQQARENIPPGMGDPQMGPIATGMSEIYQFEVRAKPGYDFGLMDLRTILDWQIAFQLRSVPGVIEVNTFGGQLKTYEIQIDPDKLLNYDVSLSRVFAALEENNGNAGGGSIMHGAEQRLIRGEGLVATLDDIRNIVLDSRSDGTPIRVADIGEVRFAPMLRQGAVTRDGDREAVTGMVMMIMGGNSRQVVTDVKAKIEQINATLPDGVYIDTFYDRTELVMKTIHTIAENIGVGVVLVIIMLFLLLGDVRAGLIVAAAIPLSAMSALIAMKVAGVSANLMSLGAVDFGVIVDGAVVMIENAVRAASAWQRTHGKGSVPKEVFKESSKEVGTPILFAGLIVIIVFIPILSLEGVEGKMFKPMAFTFMSALTAALVLSVTVMPVMASLFLARRVSASDTFLVRGLKRVYEPLLRYAMGHPVLMISVATAVFAVSVFVASGFGLEFVPKLDEGDIAVQAVRLPSVSLETSLEMTKAMERTLLKFPQVESVISKTGRPEIANDPMGVHQTDILVRLKSSHGGGVVGEVFEGQRRFPMQVRLEPAWREDVERLRQLKIDDPHGRQIPISQLADIVIEDGPSEISRHAIRRRLLIQCNVRGRDLAGFVTDAQKAVAEQITLPSGYSLAWGGQFENLQRASRRLMIAVPVALFLIFSLLYVTFSSVSLTMLIYLNVPIAATGGIFALWMRGMPFSISAGVGFIALFGIAVMNGVVLIEHVRHLRHVGRDQKTAVSEGAMDRLRPVLMTATCGALGFVPMAVSGSAGAEVQRPLATVVIGGLITCTILTLLVLPAIYGWFEPKEPASH